MRRFMVLVTVALLAAAMVVLTALPASASAGLTVKGVAVDPIVCETPAVIAPNIGWRNGQCWVFYTIVSP